MKLNKESQLIQDAIEWANKRLEPLGEPLTDRQINYIRFAVVFEIAKRNKKIN